MSDLNESFELDFKSVETITNDGDADPYIGNYEVIPKVKAQTLNTANKLMKKDVLVLEIPYFDVSNSAGGNTIYIGTEV